MGLAGTAATPTTRPSGPLIWLAREGPAVIGQYATMPVRLSLAGREVDAAWGMDVMVAPERQRQGLGEILFGTWDKRVGASLGLGLSQASSRLFKKLRWPEVGPVPCLVKPLTRRAVRQPGWPPLVNRVVSALTLPVVKVISRPRAPARRDGPHAALRRGVHCAVGTAGAEVRVRRAARRGLPAVEVRRPAARALPDRRAACARASRPATPSTATCTKRAAG